MCTYYTVKATVSGAAKGPEGPWHQVGDAAVYLDHPVAALAEHTVNIDLTGPGMAPASRVAVELTPESARRLVAAIEEALAAAPELARGSA